MHHAQKGSGWLLGLHIKQRGGNIPAGIQMGPKPVVSQLLKDYRIPAMQALAAYQMGKHNEGLRLLKKAIEGITPESSHATFLQEIKKKADSIESTLRTRHAAPVPAKDRKYEMSSGTTSVIAEKDEANGTITMGIMGGHDPDGGRQDGCDDGIIECDWKNITQPSEIYRPKQ